MWNWKEGVSFIFFFLGRRKGRVLNVENSKKALLIGLNYPGTNYSLQGCINDVARMKQCLVNTYGFLERDITVLIDTDSSSTTLPTRDNILLELSKLVDEAKGGDLLFIHFSGHGGRRCSNDEDDDTGFDEFIITSDGEHITDDDFREVVNRVPMGCWITILADCCHSGGLIEGAKEQIGHSAKEKHQNQRTGFEFSNFPPEGYIHVNYRSASPSTQIDAEQQIGEAAGAIVSLGLTQTQQETRFAVRMRKKLRNLLDSIFGASERGQSHRGILLSACQSDQLAGEGIFAGDSEVCGVFTHTILGIIHETGGQITHRELVLKVGRKLMQKGFLQEPGLYSSDYHADVKFLGGAYETQN